VCCSVLQYVIVCCGALDSHTFVLQCVAVCCSAVCCSVLQCATACISVCCGVFSSRPDPVSPMSHSLGGMLAPDSVWIVTVAVLPKSLSVCRRWWRLTKCVSIATTVSPQTPSGTCRSYRQVFTHLDEPPYPMYQFCSLAAARFQKIILLIRAFSTNIKLL